MKSRAFNSVRVDPSKNFLIKSSCDTQKLKDEINYYLNIPSELNDFFPELLNYSTDYSHYTLRYYPYKNLAQILLFSQVCASEGKKIISSLLSIAHEIHTTVSSGQDTQMVVDFYINKTLERVARIEKNSQFKALCNESLLRINQQECLNFKALQHSFIDCIQQYKPWYSLTAIHGDFCFSNILYSEEEQSVKLIDPRGSFGASGIYGDKNYDFAKLMHCLHGRYDAIANDHFVLIEHSSSEYTFKVPQNMLIDELYVHYTGLLAKVGIPLELIYLIEASLFLSMVPLHYENPQRQKVLYLTGLLILNKLLKGVYRSQSGIGPQGEKFI